MEANSSCPQRSEQPDSVAGGCKSITNKDRQVQPEIKDEKEKKSNLSSLVSVKSND